MVGVAAQGGQCGRRMLLVVRRKEEVNLLLVFELGLSPVTDHSPGDKNHLVLH